MLPCSEKKKEKSKHPRGIALLIRRSKKQKHQEHSPFTCLRETDASPMRHVRRLDKSNVQSATIATAPATTSPKAPPATARPAPDAGAGVIDGAGTA